MNEGQKATIIRAAAKAMMADDLICKSPANREALRELSELPSVSLAIFFDAIEHAAKGGA